MIELDTHKATGLKVFQYWHSCPKCRYQWIEESAGFCGGCGEKVEFFYPPHGNKERDDD